MDELKSLLNEPVKNRDLVDRLMQLLDRQTDHKLSPHLLLGFLGLFNLLTIMNVICGEAELGFKEVAGPSESGGETAQSLGDVLSGMIKGKGSGQPDLMGLLGSLAGKKNINPNLLLSLFSMLNNQAGSGGMAGPVGSSTPAAQADASAASGSCAESGLPAVSGKDGPVQPEVSAEKKTDDEKRGMELRYERKRGAGERA